MRRAGHLFEQIVDFRSLRDSARRAARGKRLSVPASRFLADLEIEVLRLREELVSDRYTPHPYFSFCIQDPKPRTISAAHFRDRVVHHALCAALEPVFERYAIPDSFACRPGKGSHAAVERAHSFTRRYDYSLKLDVRHFFETCDHEVLTALLAKLVKDQRVVDLARQFIDAGAPGSPVGKGLPIGNLTSQNFANLYLGKLDHHIKETLRVRGYLRYMDDMLLFSDSKRDLWLWHDEVREFLEQCLRLELKTEATRLAPVSEGVHFLGFRIWRGLVRLDRQRRKRFLRKLRLLQHALDDGLLDEETAARSAQSTVAWAAQANTLQLRRSLMREFFRERRGRTTGSNRVKRGGSWNNNASNCRSANRNRNDPGDRNNDLGFRPASSRHKPDGRRPRTPSQCYCPDHCSRAGAVREGSNGQR